MPTAKARKARLVKPPSENRRSHSVDVGRLVSAMAAPALKKHGAVDKALRDHWAAMVGERIAACAQPTRIRQGKGMDAATLVLTVESAAAPIVDHQRDWLMDIVNQHFGYRAVGRIELISGEVKGSRRKTDAPAKQSESSSADILARLGEAIEEREKGTD